MRMKDREIGISATAIHEHLRQSIRASGTERAHGHPTTEIDVTLECIERTDFNGIRAIKDRLPRRNPSK